MSNTFLLQGRMAQRTGRQARALIQRCAQSPHAPARPNLPAGRQGLADAQSEYTDSKLS